MAGTSPKIADHGWGRITVDGRTFKDARLWPGGAGAWDWNETGTGHTAGVQAADVEDLLGHGATHVVLSRGRQGRLGVSRGTTALLEDRGIPHDVLMTDEAIARYEQLRVDGVAVGALIHTTC
ncbi:MAG TPA: Mth938-like domain-containing protein [Euzebyales bacterium]|nr:Mth938-like domain-containing protein [Euzebyales bacterium]